jgi:hypothetical protein
MNGINFKKNIDLWFCLSLTMLLLWLAYTFGFSRGYQDAENDLIKKGYNFDNAIRAFR